MKQLYINTQTNTYPLTVEAIKKENPNVSFSKIFVPPAHYALVIPTEKPSFDEVTQVVVEQAPQLVEDNWIQVWRVVDRYYDFTDESGNFVSKLEQENFNRQRIQDAKAEYIRNTRNDLLAETDFYALTDVVPPASILAYRQALRDITLQPGFPSDVIWPVKPNT